MWVVLLQATLLLTALIMVDKVAPACITAGFFGDKCMYQCHCEGTTTCASNGDCLNNVACAKGYFGPKCQYVNVATGANVVNTTGYLNDSDDSTCNGDKQATIAEVFFKKAIPIYWMRIITTNTSESTKFLLTLGQQEACSNEKRFAISETVTDITCDSGIHVNRIQLQGDIVKHLCSVYVSGGRNIALNQNAVQSSDRQQQPTLNAASHAVDGNKDPEYQHGSCTHTVIENVPHWNLTLDKPTPIFKIEITNRNTEHDRDEGRFLETFDEQDNRIDHYVVPDPYEAVSIVYVSSKKLVSKITITISNQVTFNDRIMTLCEVEVFGEPVCDEGKWGMACGEECTCDKYETCSQITGACAPGCPDGFYGFNCLNRCSKYCRDKKCLQRQGHCDGCHAGYQGTDCTTECGAGFYGEDCKLACSTNCLDTCEFRTGECSCKANYSGTLCTECFPGFYGKKCITPCPSLCRDGRCDIVKGECVECIGRRIGPFCLDCPDGFYGPLCQTKCSDFCKNGLCNKLNGHCPKCVKKYHGPHCRYPPLMIFSWKFIIPPIILLLILLTVLFWCLKKSRGAVHEER